jgi:hypothetical protein
VIETCGSPINTFSASANKSDGFDPNKNNEEIIMLKNFMIYPRKYFDLFLKIILKTIYQG